MIRAIEELSLNAWPALQTLLADGWLLRFANGYTRRANSVQPLYPPAHTLLADQIARCEALYRAQGQPVIYKLTEASCPAGLDEALAARGYRRDAPTAVQTLRLMDAVAPNTVGLHLEATPSDAWLAAFCRMGRVGPRHWPTLRQMVGRILPPACFAALRAGSEIIACGMAVAEAGHVGLFDIAVDPAHRRQGHGRRLVSGLLAWGRAQGAHTAYLQVMLDNLPALALYAGLGFTEAYRYWYRVKE